MKKLLAGFALVALLLGQLTFPALAAETSNIELLPSLSSSTVLNGQTLKIQVRATSAEPITRATAEIVEFGDILPMQRISGDAREGIWTAQWIGHDLQEQEYHVRLRFTDAAGFTEEDNTLSFTDPLLGISTPGVSKDANANMRRISSNDSGGVGGFVSSDIDAVNGFIYYITDSLPATVTKFDTATFSHIESFNLQEGYGAGTSIVFDPVNSYLYAVTSNGYVVRIDANPANPFTEIAAIHPGSNAGGAIAIDSGSQKLYFGGSNDEFFKIDINPGNTLAVESTLTTSVTGLSTAVIDVANQFIYIGTSTSPASSLLKIDLGSFSEVASILLNPSDNTQVASVLDSVNSFAYFRGIDGVVQKVDTNPLNPFAVVATLPSTGGAFSRAATIDLTNSYVYFASDNPIFEKLNLSTFTWEANITPPTTEMTNFQTSVLDPNTGLIYFGRRTGTANVTSIDPSTDTFPNTQDMPLSTSPYTAGFIDTDNDYGYFIYTNFEYSAPLSHGGLARVRLSDLSDQGIITFNTLEDHVTSVAVDKTNGFAYLGTNTDPALIIKIDLNTFTRVGSITLPAGEGFLISAVMDEANGFAYFGSRTGKVIKIDLNTFTETGDSPLVLAGNLSTGAAIDTTTNLAYFGTETNEIVKIDLNTFTQTGDSPLVLGAGEDNIRAISLDIPSGVGYFSLDYNPGRIVKVDLATFTEIGLASFTGGDGSIRASAIDLGAQKLYLSTINSQILKVDLQTFSPDGKVVLPNQERPGDVLAFDEAKSNLFMATKTNKARIIKVSASRKNRVNAYKVNLPATAMDIPSFHVYSHNGTGNLRLAMYDSALNLVWESGVIPNNTTDGWIDVDTNTGTPSTLANIAAGDYWLAVQTDSAADVLSIAPPAGPSDGIAMMNQSFGTFPATLSGTATDDRYALYATYTLPPTVLVTQSGGSTDVSEGTLGHRAGYDDLSFALGTQPTDDVVLTLTPDVQLNADPTSLTFTPVNWNTPQYATIGATNDLLPEGDHTGNITYTLTSSDLSYNNLSVPATTVNIIDNDVAPTMYMASDVLGQSLRDGKPTFTTGAANNGGAVGPNGFQQAALISLDPVHHLLAASDIGNTRVLIYNLDSENNLVDKNPDFVLGQPDFTATGFHTFQNSFGAPTTPTFDPIRQLLYVVDQATNRIDVFDARPSGSVPRNLCGTITTGLANGMDASCVLGQVDFNGIGSGTSQTEMSLPVGAALDLENQRLYVGEIGNARVLVFDVRLSSSSPQSLCGTVTTGLANGMNASCVIGQPDFTTNTPADGQNGLGGVLALAYDAADERLFVPDPANNRTMVFDTTTLANHMPASHVLGQTDFVSTTAATTQSGTSKPVVAGYDEVRKQLFISEFNTFGGPDPINNRIMVYDVDTITDGEPATMVLGSPSYATASFYTTQGGFIFPLAAAIDGLNHRLYTGDLNNNRFLKFEFIRFTTDAVPNVVKGVNYSHSFTTEQAQGVVSYVVSAGSLPPGLSLSAGGVLSGVPTQDGTYNFTVRATDAVGPGSFFDTRNVTMTVYPGTAGGGGGSGGAGGSGGGGSPTSPGNTNNNTNANTSDPSNGTQNGNANHSAAGENGSGGGNGSSTGATMDEVTPQNCTRHSTTVVPFTDTEESWSKRFIDDLYRSCIISGKTQDSFDPKGNITRAEVTKISLNMFNLGKDGYEPIFSDVFPQDWYAPYVLQGYILKIVQGYEVKGAKPLFKPNQVITRAEALKVLLLAKGADVDGEKTSFPDVPEDAWYYRYVAYAANKGIVKGYEVEGQPTKFHPDQYITREEFAKIAVLTGLLPAGE